MSTTRPVPSTLVTQQPFGLVAWLESTRIELPLKGVECRFDVCGDVVDVEIDQIYHQSYGRPLECTYSFPLPAGATVYRCEMHVNGRVIRAIIEEEGKAFEIFMEKVEQGRRAALVEVERDNLFTLTLGNLQPGDVIVMRFAYFQLVERLGAQASLRVPVCPGVRYIPGVPLLRDLFGRGTADDTDQVPDASRISPPRIDALDPQAAYFWLEGSIDGAMALAGTITSPTHPVFIRQPENAHQVFMADRGAVPDRDFVLRWTEPEFDALTPLAWSYREGGTTYALAQLRAPHLEKADDNYEQDIYFLIDRSGSMKGAKWTKTCEALKAFVRLLGEKDRAWITFFESGFRDFAEAPLPAARIIGTRAFQRIERLGVDGGTELLPALRHVLEKAAAHSKSRVASIILITDGQVGNEEEIVGAMAAHPKVRLHAFGIDTAVNDALLKRLAAQQRGHCFLQTPDDDIAGTIAGLGDSIRRPVLTDITEDSGWELAAPRLPDLFAGQVIDVSAAGANHAAAIVFCGLLPDGSPHRAEFVPLTVRNRAIRLLWAREKIDALLAADARSEAIALAKKHNILCKGVSFVAWDDEEKVPVGMEKVYQPSMVFACASPSQSAGSWDTAHSYRDVLSAGIRSVPQLRGIGASSKKHNSNSGTSFGDFIDADDAGGTLLNSRIFEDAQELAVPGDPAEFFKDWEKSGPRKFVEKVKEKRRLLEQVPLFASDTARRFLDAICHWVMMDKSQVKARTRQFEEAVLDCLALASDETRWAFWSAFLEVHCKNTIIYSRAAALLSGIQP